MIDALILIKHVSVTYKCYEMYAQVQVIDVYINYQKFFYRGDNSN
jgi:hypothetical protein